MRVLLFGLTITLAAVTAAASETIEWTTIPNSEAPEPSELQAKLASCWSIPGGVENAEDLIVKVVIVIGNDGRPTHVGVIDPKKTKTGKMAAESAVEAVEKCSDGLGLGPGEYRVTFDPATMF